MDGKLPLAASTVSEYANTLERGADAERKTASEHRGSHQDLPQPARTVAGRYRAPHRIAALLFVARRKRPHRAVSGNAGQDRRGHGHFAGRLLSRHGNAARQRNAENAWRAVSGRDPLPGRDQALQLYAFGWRQTPGAGHDSQDGHHDSASGAQAPGSPPRGLTRNSIWVPDTGRL